MQREREKKRDALAQTDAHPHRPIDGGIDGCIYTRYTCRKNVLRRKLNEDEGVHGHIKTAKSMSREKKKSLNRTGVLLRFAPRSLGILSDSSPSLS